MEYLKKIIRESILVLLICTFITMFSGMALSSAEEMLSTIPFLVLIMPAMNDVIGDMCQVLVGRFSSHLYIGLIPAQLAFTPRVRTDFNALFTALVLSAGTMLGINLIISLISGISFGSLFSIILVVFCTALSLFLTMFVTLFFGAIYIFKRNKDPNNFLIPITTSMIDTLSPIFMILFTFLFA